MRIVLVSLVLGCSVLLSNIVQATLPGRCSLALLKPGENRNELAEITKEIQALQISIASQSDAIIGSTIPLTELDYVWESLSRLKNERPTEFQKLLEIVAKYYPAASEAKNKGHFGRDHYEGLKRFFDLVLNVNFSNHELFSGAETLHIDTYLDFLEKNRSIVLKNSTFKEETSPLGFVESKLMHLPQFNIRLRTGPERIYNRRVILFGSYFSGRASVEFKSDIDISAPLKVFRYYRSIPPQQRTFDGLHTSIKFNDELFTGNHFRLPINYSYYSNVYFSINHPLIGSREIVMHIQMINDDGRIFEITYSLQGDTFVRIHEN